MIMDLIDDKFRVWLDSAKFVKGKSGVYVLYNRNKDAIFVGSSDNLQKKFTKYVDTNFENDPCKQKTVFYQREFVENSEKRKKQILEDFSNNNGKLPNCNC